MACVISADPRLILTKQLGIGDSVAAIESIVASYPFPFVRVDERRGRAINYSAADHRVPVFGFTIWFQPQLKGYQ